jgi:four helix bundle protein
MGQGAWGREHRAEGMGQRAEGMGQGAMAKFRFQDLKIWHSAIEIANELFDIADDLERRRLYRWAEQLRGSGMSMSNNIAEGSGSSSKKDFSSFLNIARRSTFENANALILFEMRKLISQEQRDELLTKLDFLCRQITSFQKSLK